MQRLLYVFIGGRISDYLAVFWSLLSTFFFTGTFFTSFLSSFFTSFLSVFSVFCCACLLFVTGFAKEMPIKRTITAENMLIFFMTLCIILLCTAAKLNDLNEDKMKIAEWQEC